METFFILPPGGLRHDTVDSRLFLNGASDALDDEIPSASNVLR